MLEKTTPEKVGISSKNIKKFISVLEKNHLSTHAVLMMRQENKISLIMQKNAEDFLQTYSGYAEGSLK